jgi:hypothetical protein
MGREIKRVPIDFDWPLNEVWKGFLAPENLRGGKCPACENGYSPHAEHLHNRWYGYVPFDPSETGSQRLTPDTPAVRALVERNVHRSPEYYGRGEAAIVREGARLCELWNAQWSHHLHQDDVDALIAGGRLYDFTHKVIPGEGWEPIDPPPTVTAEQVNAWSIQGFGHDSINCWVAVRAACERAGKAVECSRCGGHGSVEKYEGQRAEADAWTATEPPTGEGWQLWSTTTEGHPMSPVFASADELATWMSDPERGDQWVPGTVAAKFIADGWAPSLAGTPDTGVTSGVEFMGTRD